MIAIRRFAKAHHVNERKATSCLTWSFDCSKDIACKAAQRIKSSAPGGHTLRVKASLRCLLGLGIEPLAYRKAVRAAALP